MIRTNQDFFTLIHKPRQNLISGKIFLPQNDSFQRPNILIFLWIYFSSPNSQSLPQIEWPYYSNFSLPFFLFSSYAVFFPHNEKTQHTFLKTDKLFFKKRLFSRLSAPTDYLISSREHKEGNIHSFFTIYSNFYLAFLDLFIVCAHFEVL